MFVCFLYEHNVSRNISVVTEWPKPTCICSISSASASGGASWLQATISHCMLSAHYASQNPFILGEEWSTNACNTSKFTGSSLLLFCLAVAKVVHCRQPWERIEAVIGRFLVASEVSSNICFHRNRIHISGHNTVATSPNGVSILNSRELLSRHDDLIVCPDQKTTDLWEEQWFMLLWWYFWKCCGGVGVAFQNSVLGTRASLQALFHSGLLVACFLCS